MKNIVIIFVIYLYIGKSNETLKKVEKEKFLSSFLGSFLFFPTIKIFSGKVTKKVKLGEFEVKFFP